MPARCTISACARATASRSSPTTAWTICWACSPAGGSARSPRWSTCASPTSSNTISPIMSPASSSTPTTCSTRSRRAALHSPSIRSLVCMDGPQPNAESLPDLLKADFRRRPIPPTRTPSRTSPTRPAPPASPRARAWRTSRPCGRRTASPSGCGSRATTCRSGRPRCRAPTSWSATSCRRCIAASPSTSWDAGPRRPAGTRWRRRRPASWSATRHCSTSC